MKRILWLFVTALLFASLPAHAQYTTRTGDICVQVLASFDDLAGDTWIVSSQLRPARGFRVMITDRGGTRDRYEWLSYGDTACLFDYEVDVLTTGQLADRIAVRMNSKALVNEVELHSWNGISPSAKTFRTASFPNVTVSTNAYTVNLTITSTDQVWRNLLVGGMVFRFWDWNVNAPNDRACCLGGFGYDPDGTCPNPATGGYELLTTPIQLQTWPTDDPDSIDDGGSPGDGYCCGSTLQGSSNQPGAVTGENVPIKFSIAHELGHVIAAMRMGGREGPNGEDPLAPEDGCLGDYKLVGSTYVLVRDMPVATVGTPETGAECGDLLDEGEDNPADGIGDDGCTPGARGEFSKEYMAMVLREAWGNFVSAVTWNDRANQDDCEFQVNYRRYDFDLDGQIDFDDTYAATATHTAGSATVPGASLSGTYDCEGIPQVNGMNPAAPAVATYVTAVNWLEDVEDVDDDNQDGVQCVRDADFVAEYNRSTVSDATAMFWDLTTDQALTPNQLSDLYVDMCPRNWTTSDMTAPDDSMPRSRLAQSALFHGILTKVTAEAGHVSH